jgi:hypothetical protein
MCFECGRGSDQHRALKEVAATTSPIHPAQFAETWSRHGGRIKCFREFVIGPYRCHWYPL